VNCLIVGCGYLGQRVARLWNETGNRVYAITRSKAKVDQLLEKSISPIVVDWYQSDGWPELPDFDRLLISVSHSPIPNVSHDETHVRGLNHLFTRSAFDRCKIAYLSTTGVYAPCDDGRWIDENSPVLPNRPGAIAAYAAERWIGKHIPSDRYSILRAAGIYGPGRVPRLDKLQANEPLEADPESYLNLIHVDDLARIAVAVMEHPSAVGVFNVSDGHPVLRRDYYQFIANSIDSPLPQFSSPNANELASKTDSTGNRARGEGSKRIANHRIIQAIGYRFQIADYIAGLTPLIKPPITTPRS